jgi:hypothetical protein
MTTDEFILTGQQAIISVAIMAVAITLVYQWQMWQERREKFLEAKRVKDLPAPTFDYKIRIIEQTSFEDDTTWELHHYSMSWGWENINKGDYTSVCSISVKRSFKSLTDATDVARTIYNLKWREFNGDFDPKQILEIPTDDLEDII